MPREPAARASDLNCRLNLQFLPYRGCSHDCGKGDAQIKDGKLAFLLTADPGFLLAHISGEWESPLSQPMSSEDGGGAVEAALDLLRRLPPQKVKENLQSVIQLLPEHTAELLNIVDVPTNVRVCEQTNREYLACDYNRDGNSYRSPWSNQYDPPLVGREGLCPPERFRRLEVLANDAFATYHSLYYEGGLSSVYVWEVSSPKNNTNCFAAAILIKKETDSGEVIRSGAWDAIHVVEVEAEAQPEAAGAGAKGSNQAIYKLTTTIILHLDTLLAKLDSFVLSGSMTRQEQQRLPLATGTDEEHIVNIGRMVEEMESRMRSSLQEIYFGKTHDVVNEIRPVVPAGFLRHQVELQKEMAGRLGGALGSRPPTKEFQSATREQGEQQQQQ